MKGYLDQRNLVTSHQSVAMGSYAAMFQSISRITISSSFIIIIAKGLECGGQTNDNLISYLIHIYKINYCTITSYVHICIQLITC